MGCAGKYPEVLPVGVADYGIAVIVRQINDPVFAFEREKELHFQLGIAGMFHHECLALYVRLFAMYAVFVASVFNNKVSFIAQGIFGSCTVAALLEALRERSDFVPFSGIFLYINKRYGFQVAFLCTGPEPKYIQ